MSAKLPAKAKCTRCHRRQANRKGPPPRPGWLRMWFLPKGWFILDFGEADEVSGHDKYVFCGSCAGVVRLLLSGTIKAYYKDEAPA